MPTVILPEGRELPLDREVFSPLLRAALEATLALLSSVQPPTIRKQIYHSQPQLISARPAELPRYNAPQVFETVEKVWRSPAVESLSEYIWRRNAFKNSLTTDDSRVPGRDDWVRFIFDTLILTPLFNALDTQRIEDSVEGKQLSSWSVSPSKLDNITTHFAARHCDHIIKVRCLSLIMGVELEQPEASLAPGLVIRRVDHPEASLLLSRLLGSFPWRDLTQLHWDAAIDLQFDVSTKDDRWPFQLIETAADHLDLVKWALLSQNNTSVPYREQVCIMESLCGERIGRLARDERDAWRSYKLGGAATSLLASSMLAFRQFELVASSIRGALWHFGRACIAPLDRDKLLESVIGIESLIADKGDNTYKFRLHGAAMLADDPDQAETFFKQLGKIYNARSTAAHGHSTTNADIANEALRLFGRLIARILQAFGRGDLPLQETKGDVPEAIRRYVLKRACTTWNS